MTVSANQMTYTEFPSTLFRRFSNWTDKETVHSYGSLYDSLLKGKNVKTIVEVGVLQGGSIMAWAVAYPSASVTGIDATLHRAHPSTSQYSNVTLLESNAYNPEIAELFDKIDVFVDDGPHTLESQILAIQNYLPRMSPSGVFIIEDIQSASDAEVLKKYVPAEYKSAVTIYDISKQTGRYDDVLFVIDLGKKQVKESN